MNKPLLAAGALLLGGIVTGGAIFVASSGGEEEAVQVQESRSPSVGATPGGSPSPSSSVSATPTPGLPLPSLPPPDVPAAWETFMTNEAPKVRLRYPNGWLRGPGEGRISSFDPSTVKGSQYPPNGVVIDVDRTPLDQPGLPARPPEAVDTVLGGVPAWEVVQTDLQESEYGKRHVVVVERNGYRYGLFAALVEASADEATFVLILSSFRFIQ